MPCSSTPEDMIWRKSADINSNKKLMLRNRIRGHILAEDVIDTTTGELLAAAGTKVTAELADTIQNSAVPFCIILRQRSAM